jgi:hypothetical protein
VLRYKLDSASTEAACGLVPDRGEIRQNAPVQRAHSLVSRKKRSIDMVGLEDRSTDENAVNFYDIRLKHRF